MANWSLEYGIDVDEPEAVIRITVHGQWQADTANQYHDDFVEEMAPLMGRPWAKIADLSAWKTSRNEVTEVIGRHMAWSRKNGVAMSLYVIDNVSTLRQLKEMFDKGGTRKVSKTFRTLAEAEAYLKKHWPTRRKQRV